MNPAEILDSTESTANTAEVVTIVVPGDSAKPETKSEVKQRDVASDIGEIIDFAREKLADLQNVTLSAEQYASGVAKLKELRAVVESLHSLLERSNSALKDEKAQLMKRLEEIQRAMSATTMGVRAKKEESVSWEDITALDEKRLARADRDHRRGNSPVDSFDATMEDRAVHGRHRNKSHRGRGTGGVGANAGGSGGSVSRLARSDHDHRSDDSDQDDHASVRLNGPTRTRESRGDARDTRDVRVLKKPPRPQGSRIPMISANPLNRRVVMDDIEGFALIVKQDGKYGQLVTFAPPFDNIVIGGIIEIVPDRPAGKQNMCEPLYLEGMCNCSTNALVLHGGKPLQIAVVDFVAILHKFINNFSGNVFHPRDSSRSTMDAIVLRCVIHAIVQIKGIRRGQLALTIGSFSDATEPKNLLNAVSDYYHRKNDVDPMSVARGLFTALATHFVSS